MGGSGLEEGDPEEIKEKLRSLISVPNDRRLWAMMTALRRGMSWDEIYQISGVDPFFLSKMANIVAMERRLLREKDDSLFDAGGEAFRLFRRADWYACRYASRAGEIDAATLGY